LYTSPFLFVLAPRPTGCLRTDGSKVPWGCSLQGKDKSLFGQTVPLLPSKSSAASSPPAQKPTASPSAQRGLLRTSVAEHKRLFFFLSTREGSQGFPWCSKSPSQLRNAASACLGTARPDPEGLLHFPAPN